MNKIYAGEDTWSASIGGKAMVNKLKKEQQIVYNLFLGAAFTGFAFDNFFILKFNRETPVDISGVSFNGDFKIIISS